MSTSPSVSSREIGEGAGRLRAALHGELILPGDASYEEARQIWNGAIERHPAVVVRCADANDVLRAVEFGQRSSLEIAVRGGGHSPAGFSMCDGGLVIDLSPMKEVRVDPSDRSARAQPGATLGELIQVTEAYDLVIPTGTVSDVGIAGLTLGGGVGLLVGKYGLTCDNVRSFDLVTADCRLVRASAWESPDLFWGLRGGGTNFGVVTGFEYQLHPVGRILGGTVVHPRSRIREVLRFYRDFTRQPPDELTAGCAVVTGPDGSPVVSIAACYCGNLAQGERTLAALREFGPPLVDRIQPMPYSGIFSILDPTYRSGRHYHMKGSGVTELSDAVIDALVDSAEGVTSAFSQVLILPVHGAATRISTSDTAFSFRQKHYNVLHVAAWEDDAAERHLDWMEKSWQALRPFASQLAYVNFMDNEGPARIRAAYGPNYERLVALKDQYDPDNVFHLNQNIRPTPISRR